MPLKAQIAPLLHRLALHTGVSAWRGRAMPWMRILMIHGVGGSACPAAGLRAQLTHLKRHYRVVPLAELLGTLSNPQSRPDREVVLTFDDGLRNNFAIAAPILQELGLPATFFVCPGLIDREGWLWNHEARARLGALSDAERHELSQRLGSPGESIDATVEWMKTLPLDSRERVEEALRAATPKFRPSDRQRAEHDLMSWKELAVLDPGLFTIGAHTVSHPILTGLSPAEMEYEIGESRRWLETALGRPVSYFCYPNGAASPPVAACVRKHFAAAVTTEIGPVLPGDDPCLLQRIPVATDAHLLAWRMHRPGA